MNGTEARSNLARLLFEEMERLAPSANDEGSWSEISEWERLLYLNCVDRLLCEHNLIRLACEISDDDEVFRGAKKAK